MRCSVSKRSLDVERNEKRAERCRWRGSENGAHEGRIAGKAQSAWIDKAKATLCPLCGEEVVRNERSDPRSKQPTGFQIADLFEERLRREADVKMVCKYRRNVSIEKNASTGDVDFAADDSAEASANPLDKSSEQLGWMLVETVKVDAKELPFGFDV